MLCAPPFHSYLFKIQLGLALTTRFDYAVVLREFVGALGGITAIAVAVARNSDRPLALLVYRKSGVVIWDVRCVTTMKSSSHSCSLIYAMLIYRFLRLQTI